MPATFAESLVWIDPDGNQYNLMDPTKYYVPYPGLNGGYGIPLTVQSFEAVGIAGDFEQFLQVTPNEIRMPILIMGDTAAGVQQALRELRTAMRPQRGHGLLQHGSIDGQTRVLSCIEVGRFRDIGSQSPSAIQAGLIFRAADPYWQDAADIVQTLSPGGGTTFFQNPVLPLHLSPSSASGAFYIENNGDAECWPKWMITGPGTNPVLTNVTTGEILTLTITLTAGQVLTVDTNPATLSITREDGSVHWDAVSPSSTMWSIAVGTNSLTLGMSGTTGASQLQLLYRRRWESI
jgi:hypothetical protein